ncbi:MAG: cytochrome oxidase putative small subunit CydP [Gammaproteobacteria bacterium]
MDSSGNPTARRGKLGREIILVLIFKALALTLIWAVFFSAPPVPHPGPQATAAKIMGSAAFPTPVIKGISHD